MEAFLQSHWFPDVLILIVIILFAVIKGIKGFFKCVIPVIILIASLVGAYFLTPLVEPAAQEKLIPFVEKRVVEKMDAVELGTIGDLSDLIGKNDDKESKSGNKDISSADDSLAESIIGSLPDGIKELVEKYGVNVGDTVKEQIDDIKIGDGIKDQMTKSVAALVTTAAKKAIHTGCYVVIALALLLVLSILKLVIDPVIKKTPVVSQANKTAGAILGVLEAILLVYLAVSIMKLFNICDIVTVAKDTYLLKLFMTIDPKGIVSLVAPK